MRRFRYSLITLFVVTLVAALFALAARNWQSLVGKALFVVVGAAIVAILPATWAAKKQYPGISQILVAGFIAGGSFGLVVALSLSWLKSEDTLQLFAFAVLAAGSSWILGGFAGMIVALIVAFLALQGNMPRSKNDDVQSESNCESHRPDSSELNLKDCHKWNPNAA